MEQKPIDGRLGQFFDTGMDGCDRRDCIPTLFDVIEPHDRDILWDLQTQLTCSAETSDGDIVVEANDCRRHGVCRTQQFLGDAISRIGFPIATGNIGRGDLIFREGVGAADHSLLGRQIGVDAGNQRKCAMPQSDEVVAHLDHPICIVRQIREQFRVVFIRQNTGNVSINGHLDELVGRIADKDDSIEVLTFEDEREIIVLIQR